MKVQVEDSISKLQYTLVSNKINEIYSKFQEDHIDAHKYRYNGAFFICGLINNSGYVLVGAAAQEIAHHFNMDSFMSAFNLSLILFSIFLVALNANLFLRINHKTRMGTILVLSALSFVIIAFWYQLSINIFLISTTMDHKWAFYLALFGSTLTGCMQSLGETTMLGYSKNFPPKLVGFWGSGTGCAGPFGSGLYLLLVYAKVKDLYIFLCLVPCLFAYWFSFLWLDQQRLLLKTSNEEVFANDYEKANMIAADDSTDNVKLTLSSAKDVLLRYSGWFSLNLCLVYFLEYTCTVCWADRANPKTSNEGFLKDNVNTYLILIIRLMQFQTFVIKQGFLSLGLHYPFQRSGVWKYQHVYKQVLNTSLNNLLVNTTFWIFIALTHSIEIYYQLLLMVFVGFMGGASYVNVAYLILSSPNIPNQFRELAMNVSNMSNNVGITFAAVTAMIISNVWK